MKSAQREMCICFLTIKKDIKNNPFILIPQTLS